MLRDRLNKRIKLSNEVVSKLVKIDELKGQWKGALNLNPKILHQLKKSVVITSSASSTRIEGSQMSDRDVEKFLKSIKKAKPKNRDEQEVAGYADLLGRIFDNYQSIKINESSILQLHKILLAFADKDKNHRGKYKRQDNTVAIVKDGKIQKILFQPTAPYLVKKEMDDLFEWFKNEQKKKELHPLVVVANLIFEFLAIHPFIDGNGRLSRALINLMMLQMGYGFVPYISLEEIFEDRQLDYYLSLRQTQKNHKTKKEDISPWLNFYLEAVLVQAQKAIELLDGRDNEKLLSKTQLKVLEEFKKKEELAVSEIHKKTKIVLITVKQIVTRLAELQLIEKLGQGRATRYRVIVNDKL
jgi:Fic family protein